jgi:hypothetical protein
MAIAKGPRTRSRKSRKKVFLVLCAAVGALLVFSLFTGACKSSKETGKDARDTYEKS